MPLILDQLDAPPHRSQLDLLPLFERVLPYHRLCTILAPFVPATRRDRLLPAEITLQLVIAMNLYAHHALTVVVSKLFLAAGLEHAIARALPSKSAITQARQRLGVAPVRALFQQLCVPLATPTTPGAFLGAFRLMALDQTVELAADTPANRAAFSKHHNQYGVSAFPLLLVSYLLECGTHAIVDALVQSGHTAPLTAARRLVRSVRPEMLVLLDAGLTMWPIVTAVRAQGAEVLGRVGPARILPPIAGLPDGSYLAYLWADSNHHLRTTPRLLVRVLVYTLDLPGWPHHGETSRLITTLLDAERYPARTLIAAYHERWEIELAIDEIDTHQRPVGRPLRSKTPMLVIQEFYGLLIAHYLVRAEMLAAAAREQVDPDRLSFVHAVQLITVALPLAQVLTPGGREALQGRMADLLHRYRLPPRERRSNPRVVRRKSAKFPRKHETQHGISLRTPFLHAICPSPLGAALLPQAGTRHPRPMAA